ncbi:MAG: NAD(+) synthase [Oscillospiraceae bacterium]
MSKSRSTPSMSPCSAPTMCLPAPPCPTSRSQAELGADIDVLVPPSVRHAQAGATVIAQLASFPETVTSADEAELTLRSQSRRLHCGMIMAAPGKGESTTDNVFSGLCMIAENSSYPRRLRVREQHGRHPELDVEYIVNTRRGSDDFDLDSDEYYEDSCGAASRSRPKARPAATASTRTCPRTRPICPPTASVCSTSRSPALSKRMQYAGLDHCVVGISGGVDSTLAVISQRDGSRSTNVVACTMPCFGTSSRTKSNAIVVAEQIGAEVRVIDIGKSVYQHFDDIGHAHDDYSIAFENAQARERTQVLMDIANKLNGLDVGTEDLSEFIDGWCTYNCDHTSMYDVNMGLTKTQVRANVRYIAGKTEDRVLKAALYDVLDCPVTPELLPIHDDQIEQKSEDSVGSYSLQDFFTHKMLICGFGPAKTLRLAKIAYHNEFTDEELVRWLRKLLQAPVHAAVQAQLPDGRPRRRCVQRLPAYRPAYAVRRREHPLPARDRRAGQRAGA